MKTLFYLILEYLLIIKMKIRSYLMPSPKAEWQNGDKKDVVLVHGWNENWSYLYELGEYLNHQGYKIHTVQALGRNHGSVEKCAQVVNDFIISNGLKNLTLVCHSKGGLIAKMVIDRFTAGQFINKAISIATPYYGSKWGVLRFGHLKELIPGSQMLKDLHMKKDNSKIVSIRAKFDNHTVPGSSAILEGAQNIEIPIVGHTRILVSEHLMKLLPILIEN